jgi:hypothetical protein
MEGFDIGYSFRKLEERIEKIEYILEQIIKPEEKDNEKAATTATKRSTI